MQHRFLLREFDDELNAICGKRYIVELPDIALDMVNSFIELKISNPEGTISCPISNICEIVTDNLYIQLHTLPRAHDYNYYTITKDELIEKLSKRLAPGVGA